MEHLSAQPFEALEQWRRAAFVTGSIAAVELLALLVIGGHFVIPKIASELRTAATHKALAPPAPIRPKQPPPGKPKLARSDTSVIVLNGNGRAGAAGEAADRIERLHYMISSVGNAPRSDYARTIVMYRPGYRAEGARLARDLHVKTVAPLDGIRKRDLMGAHLALILGP
jgi:hypothetical protein